MACCLRTLVRDVVKQVVQDKAEVRLAGAMVGQRGCRVVDRYVIEQRLNELVQVVDLLELAAGVLVEAALARQTVQLLEQLD